jgi:hypothetical protein
VFLVEEFGGLPARKLIDFITIATTGNAQDFGDLTVGKLHLTSFFFKSSWHIWWWLYPALNKCD